jgi:hypothetical protein
MNNENPKTPVNSLLDQMLATTSEFIDIAYKMVDSGWRKDKIVHSYSRVAIAFYMRRAIELTESFVILLRQNRPVDSALLLRSFWEMGINTAYVFHDEKEKEINAVRYLLSHYEGKLKLLKDNQLEFEEGGLDVNTRKAEIQKDQEKEIAFFTKLFKTDDWKWKRIRERAEDSEDPVIKLAYTQVYEYICGVEHHDWSFGLNYIEDHGCRPLKSVKEIGPLKPDINLIMLRSILLVIMKTFNKEFCLNWGEGLKLLEAKQGQEYAEMKKRDHK